MVDVYKFAEYLERTKLSAEEFWFLYRVMILQDNNKNGVFKVPDITSNKASFNFSLWNKEYQERFKTYLDKDVDWKGLVDKLDKEGYLENWGKEYKMNEMKVTDNFTNNFLISNVEQAFMDFVKIYPSRVVNFGKKPVYASFDLQQDVLTKMYNEKILRGGNKILHDRCLIVTETYLDYGNFRDAPMKMSKYFDAFEGIARMMEDKEEDNNSFYDAI